MNTSKKQAPNQTEVAKQNLGKLEKHVTIPTEINESEKGYYHVLIVDAQFNPATLETKYNQRVQVYNDKSWLTVKDRLKQVGINHAFVFHNPNKERDLQVAKKEEKKSGGKSEAQIKRQDLIEEAKALGYEGALNAKNSVFEEFIKNAKENGEQE